MGVVVMVQLLAFCLLVLCASSLVVLFCYCCLRFGLRLLVVVWLIVVIWYLLSCCNALVLGLGT